MCLYYKMFRCFLLYVVLSFCFVLHAISLAEVEKKFFKKDFQTAKQNLKTILENDENNKKALSLLGDIYLYEKKYIQSLQIYKEIISLFPSSAYERYRIGQIYLELKKYALSLTFFQEAYSQNKQLKESLFQIGYIHLYKYRDKNQTIHFWSKFIEEKPEDVQREKIEKIIAILKDKDFSLDKYKNSASIEELLLFGGKIPNSKGIKVKDIVGGNERLKSQNITKGIVEDDGL